MSRERVYTQLFENLTLTDSLKRRTISAGQSNSHVVYGIASPSAVKILVDISPEHYDRILNELDEESRIYAILKNGLVLHHFEGGNDIRTVEILCEKFHARMILAAAEIYCPEAVAEIEEAIRLSRTLH